jgi:hypothetical protein
MSTPELEEEDPLLAGRPRIGNGELEERGETREVVSLAPEQLVHLAVGLVVRPFESSEEDVVLGLEVVVDRSRGGSRLAGDVRDARRSDTAAGDCAAGGRQDGHGGWRLRRPSHGCLVLPFHSPAR